MIKIKDFSSKTKFSIRMLRYLEEIGLLIPTRDKSNYRTYTNEQVSIATKIKKLQNLGIQLREIELLNSNKYSVQLEILNNVLTREKEIAEIKSESIQLLKSMIEYIQLNNCTIDDYFIKAKVARSIPQKLRAIGDKNKFQRVAYNIPILKTIYEDYLEPKADIELLTTDIIKYGSWIDECNYTPEVFSILHESSFAFGLNLRDEFLTVYEESWKIFFPKASFQKLMNFSKEDIKQLLGFHDIIIKTTFVYNRSKEDGELIIPYSPIYTMSQLGHQD